MADENEGNAPDAPSGDAGFDDDSMEVVLTKRQVDELFVRAKNSAAADMRRAGEFRRMKQIDEDPRVKRGLELLQRYETAAARTQESMAERDGAMQPLQERVMSSLGSTSKDKRTPAPAAQPQSASDRYYELLLARETRAMQESDAARAAAAAKPRTFNDEINDDISALDKNDPHFHTKLQNTVMSRLSDVRVTPTKKR